MAAQDVLQERYGAATPRRRHALLTGCAVLALAFLGWLLWSAWGHATPQVESDLVTYDVVDDHTATARVDVRLDGAGGEATCVLRAYAEDHVLVGEIAFYPEASGVVEQEVRTERRATTVVNVGCTAPGQRQPR